MLLHHCLQLICDSASLNHDQPMSHIILRFLCHFLTISLLLRNSTVKWLSKQIYKCHSSSFMSKTHSPISFSVHMSLCLFHTSFYTLFPQRYQTENSSVAQTIKNDHVNVDISYLFREWQHQIEMGDPPQPSWNYTLSRDYSVTYTFYNLKHTDLNTQ